jgi:hypothetical protein
MSVGSRLYPDDVGIWARTATVVCSYPVIIVRVRSQPGNVLTRCVANVQILVRLYVSDKRTARGHI